jgi:hypothetical protein
MSAAPPAQPEPTPGQETRQTVLGMFEDTIDAEQALVALRKADYPPDRISLLVRDTLAEREETADRHGAVARSVVASALDAVGGWLQGLASLIVPERGTFLVAGPIGAALAGMRPGDDERARDQAPSPDEATYVATTMATTDLSSGGLIRTFEEFGYQPEEATYLEHRLAAGAALVAVTAASATTFQEARSIFADHDAVYIGIAETEASFLAQAEALLAASPEELISGDVVVRDVVAPLVRGCDESSGAGQHQLCERMVVDRHGVASGQVEEVLIDQTTGVSPMLRYIVVAYGGVLGIGRHYVAVPADDLDPSSVPLRLQVSQEALHRAPAYALDTPFSRREEEAIYASFGLRPYWLDSVEAPAIDPAAGSTRSTAAKPGDVS